MSLAQELKPFGVDLVWGTNPDITQASKLLARTDASVVAQWEWGNEPKMNEVSAAVSLANEFKVFREALEDRFGAKHVVLVGPDVGYGAWAPCPYPGSENAQWLEAFFSVANSSVLDAANIHVYPFDHDDVGGDYQSGDPVCADEDTNPTLPWCNYTRVLWPFELFDTRPVTDFTTNFARITLDRGGIRDVRIGESASVNHGGWANVSNTFASGFWYLWELGQLARDGYTVLQRQSIAASASPEGEEEFGNYGLLSDSPDFDPNPDYFTALLWTRLKGARALDTAYKFANASACRPPADSPFATPAGLESTLRVWTHCTAADAAGGEMRGGITIAFANPQTFDVELVLPDSPAESPRSEYVLAPPAGDPTGLQSRFVSLNAGPALVVGVSNVLPALEPRVVESGAIIRTDFLSSAKPGQRRATRSMFSCVQEQLPLC